MPTFFPPPREFPGRIQAPLRTVALWLGLVLGSGLMPARAQDATPDTGGRAAITDPVQIWSLSPEQKLLRHPIRLEGRVSFFDPYWKNAWLESNGVGTYILLATEAPPLREGQRVRIEGSMIPDKGLAADSVRVTVLQEFEPVTLLETKGRIRDLPAFSGRMVTAEGYVSSQLYVDDDHVRLAMIIEDRPVIGWVKPTNPRRIPNWERTFIRVQALYSSRFNPTNTETTIELWCGPEQNVTGLGGLADSPQFDLPRTPIRQLPVLPVGTRVLVRGTAEGHNGGAFIVVRDDSGQVTAASIQPDRIPFGTAVEVVGTVDTDGARWVLRGALYRKAEDAAPNGRSESDALDNVDDIRQLSLPQAAAGRAVKVSGLVTWSMPGADFFFLQDVSGGIRVRFDAQAMEAPQLGKYLEVMGETYDGEFMPGVQLRSVLDKGSMSHPEGRLVSFEQAITGNEDGQWVAMRGFIQRVESDGDWRWLYVTTPAGEVVGLLHSPVNFVANPGSLIRVQGVCEATAAQSGQLTGVMLRVPFIHSITIEEDAPVDDYDLPVHSVKGLRRLSGARDLTRVRISGQVLHAVPGGSVYVQDGETGMQLLSRQEQALTPGDWIDAVGILGWEGARIVLREVVYRRTGTGPAPEPVAIADPARLVPALDARLVSVSGRLIDISQQADHTRFTLQSGETLFEATLNRGGALHEVELPVGAGIRLVGIYHLGFDDSRQLRRFALQVRSPADVTIVEKPRMWTVQRALIVAGVLGGFAVFGLAWITALRRRVQQQTRQIREQLERQARLEAEVQRAARLESLGALAGGMAHDFNNLLTIIIGNLGLALTDEKLGDSTVRCLREIERGAARARTLTRQLLTFAKGGDPLRVPMQVPEIVKTAAERALHGSAVRAEFNFAPEVWNALADRDQIAQVVQNLVLNAVQAMPRGGTLVVSCVNESVAVGANKQLVAGRYVKVGLADSGEGISPEALPRIFDPYFSTRRTASGLGLATVYSIIKRHAGAIDVDSRVGHGTTFSLWLPATDAPVDENVTGLDSPFMPPAVFAPTPAPGAAPSGRVLLMDDEESIQKIVTAVLQRMGFEVTAVSDGGAALREFSLGLHQHRRFDLLLLDLTIPGAMGGREAIELIRKLDPHVPAIVSSGYSNDPVMANFEAYGFQAVVPKPYDINRLRSVVNRLLGRAA